VNSTWLITSELANERERKVLFTCVAYANIRPWCFQNVTSRIVSVLAPGGRGRVTCQAVEMKTASDLGQAKHNIED